MTTTTKRSFTSKKGITINAGERVTVAFTVKDKAGELLPGYVRLETSDGRRIVTHNLEGAGFRIPSQRKLEQWVFDSVVESVFGYDVEPDGWDSEGSPSWLLVLGLV